jgi:hypothetical protein
MLPRPRAVRQPLSRRGHVGARGSSPAAVSAWALLVGVGLLVGASSGAAAPAAKTEPAAKSEPAAKAEPAPTPAGPETEGLPPIDEAALAGPQLLDGVLPCGLRVIVAQDESLPVAAVVLAIETGTEDDPPSQPGLVHALAYHLMQGNRELRPAGAPALVHDQGGIAGIAVGPAQVRYESLVPSSALPDVLWIESQRLRAPTVSDELWTSTLRWARRDTARGWKAPRAAMAAAHGAPGLEHEGRVVSKGLDDMVPRAVGLALAERFRYELATLVVVSPHPPEELREKIEKLFAELPEQPRRVRDRSPRWRTEGAGATGGSGSSPAAPKAFSGGPVGSSPAAPKALALAGEAGTELVWPVAPDPASLLQATVWCKGLNRQRRHEGEPARVRVKCHLDVDPRRPTLVVEVTGADDPVALVRSRIERLEQEDAPLVERQRQAVRHEQTLELRTPLPLARRLAAAEVSPQPTQPTEPTEPTAGEAAAPEGSPTPPPTGWRTRPVSALTGLAVLAQPWTGHRFGPRLHPGAAIHLVAPTAPPKSEKAK